MGKRLKTNKLMPLLLGFLSISILFVGNGLAADKNWPKALTISTTPAGSTLAVYGVGVAKIIEQHLKISTAPEACKGSLPAMMLMVRGGSEMAAVTAPEEYYSYFEKKPFKKGTAATTRGMLFGEYSSMAHWVVLADSDIKTIADLKGKKVMCRRPGQALYQKVWKTTLAAYGMKPSDIIAMPALSHRGATDALKEGRCDAFFHYSSAPGPAFVELSMTTPIKLLSMGKKEAEYVKNHIAWADIDVIPANTYKGQTEPTTVAMAHAGIMVNSKLSESLVYQIVKTINENFDELRRIHPSFAKWTMKGLVNGPLCPYHPGAYKYYMEQELLTEKSIQANKNLLAQMKQNK